MIHYKSDRSNRPIPAEEYTTLRLDGPLKSMLGRSCVHLTKSEAAALCRWIGVEVHRPELETIPGPASDLDSDATAPNLSPAALRVQALQSGTPANSTRPPGRKGRRSSA